MTAQGAGSAPTASASANASVVGLVVLGVIFILGGAILGFVMNGRATFDTAVAGYANVMGVGDGGRQVSTDYAWMWGGIVAAGLGVISCIAALVVYGVRRP